MINESLQWGVLALISLAVLGLFRQVSFTLPPDNRSAPEGPPVGRRAPAVLLRELALVGVRPSASQGVTVAFVSESCVGCHRLLTEVPEIVSRTDMQLVLVASKPSVAFSEALAQLGVTVIADDGAVWSACQVSATPFVIHIDADGRVQRKEVTHDVRSVSPAAA